MMHGVIHQGRKRAPFDSPVAVTAADFQLGGLITAERVTKPGFI